MMTRDDVLKVSFDLIGILEKIHSTGFALGSINIDKLNFEKSLSEMQECNPVIIMGYGHSKKGDEKSMK